jgi:Flp pilus assembly protein TadD
VVRALYDWNIDASLVEINRAIECAPDDAAAWHWRGIVLAVVGCFPEAINAIARARRLDPASI